jgi:shikimate kinase / 3-dehydroquinate synthase
MAARAVAPNALDRHVALVGFMGAGKSTLGPVLAEKLGRRFVSVDAMVEERASASVAELFSKQGEAAFRELEEGAAADVLWSGPPAVVELGGGGLGSAPTRRALEQRAFALLVETTPEEAWERVAGTDRPLAADPDRFRSLFEERRALYEETADGRARNVEDAVLAAAGVHVARGSLDRLAELAPGDGAVEVVSDANVHALYGERARTALTARLRLTHEVPAGERAKTVSHADHLWSTLRLERDGALVALGGGSTIDLAGFVAATYLRGVSWVPVPSSLLAQVDAAIGGKTAIDVPAGKNLVGAFHWPARVVVDPDLLRTLPAEELENGLAEVVKTGLLAGEPLWELSTHEQVRCCAAFKAAVCLRDPFDRGERAQLNLGHTIAHALEAASGYALPHGRAVALGLLAVLRLSGLEDDASMVEEVLAPDPAQVDRDAVWEALARDKKAHGGTARFVLLDAPGRPRWGVELEPAALRSALEGVIH